MLLGTIYVFHILLDAVKGSDIFIYCQDVILYNVLVQL